MSFLEYKIEPCVIVQLRVAHGPTHQFRYIKIQPKTIDIGTRLWGITTEFVGFTPQYLVLNFNISTLVYKDVNE